MQLTINLRGDAVQKYGSGVLVELPGALGQLGVVTSVGGPNGRGPPLHVQPGTLDKRSGQWRPDSAASLRFNGALLTLVVPTLGDRVKLLGGVIRPQGAEHARPGATGVLAGVFSPPSDLAADFVPEFLAWTVQIDNSVGEQVVVDPRLLGMLVVA
ncbi:hypothetical protein FOA52_015436 [Chlamydomonas sp. UWO 241]|nr:hypothetical protein FOA52_015436 [Chlamydomonas sp. UWO 241]